MTTQITGTIFQKPIDTSLINESREFLLGDDTRVILEDTRDGLEWGIPGKGTPSITMDGKPMGRTGVILMGRIRFTNPIHPENAIEASYQRGGIERK